MKNPIYKAIASRIMKLQYTGNLDKALKWTDYGLIFVKEKSANWCDLFKRKAFIYYLKGNVNQFLLIITKVKLAAEKKQYLPELAGCLGVLAIYYANEGSDLDKAIRHCKAAIHIREKIRKPDQKESIEKLQINLSTYYRDINDYAESIKILEQVHMSTSDTRLKINCWLEKGRTYHAWNMPGQAFGHINTALEWAKKTKFYNKQGDCHRELGRLYFLSNDLELSKKHYQQAIAIFQKYSYQKKANDLQKEIDSHFKK